MKLGDSYFGDNSVISPEEAFSDGGFATSMLARHDRERYKVPLVGLSAH